MKVHQLSVTYLREQVAQGEEEQTPTLNPVYETLVMSMDKGEGELTLQRDHSGLGEGNMDLKNIRIAPQSAPKEGMVTIDQIVSTAAARISKVPHRCVSITPNRRPSKTSIARKPIGGTSPSADWS